MSTGIIWRRRSGAQALIPALALLMLLSTGCSEKETTAPQDAAPAEAPPPVEAPEPAAEPDEPQAAAEPPASDTPAVTQTAAVDGQKIYQASCQACHDAEVAGAPKLGDKAAWAPRITKGNDALLASVKNGLNAMPPKGGCMGCSDDELRAAMDYMVEQGS
ncbi:MAG: cytochrome c5 family protein [Thiohalobacterales bacterium]